jgi:tripartite-type tricarboxylate transporter receptor subunit TctC
MQRCTLLAVLAALCLSWGSSVSGQAYPIKLVRIYVGFAPGGVADIIARDFATRLQQTWGQPFVVENRAGANGTVATLALAKAPADGHTLMLTLSSHITNGLAYKNLGYDPLTDFAPVSLAASSPLVLVAHPSFPAADVRALVALARQRPGAISYATPGTGSIQHLSVELLNYLSRTKMVPVPYRGGAPAVVDVLGGQLPLTITSIPQVLQLIQTRKLKPLGVTSVKRVPVLPEVPTFAESGVGGYESELWFGVIAPAGTPASVVQKISAEIARILNLPEVRERYAAEGNRPIGSTPDQFAELLRKEQEKWTRIFRETGIKPE